MNLEKILQDDARIWDEDILNYPQLFELARKYDTDLLEALFNNKDSKNKFFIQVGDSHVFNYNDFRFYLEQNQVNNSFTQYANKIGLSSQGEHLSDSTDYVLDWPYKDCVLEGGMSSEEDTDTFIEKKVETTPGKMNKSGNVISTEKTEATFSQVQKKREEIFYNNIIADKEIDRLLDKKALKNFTRYTAKGEEAVKEIKRDEDGTIKENLLIKGNNLLALHSLKEQFAGKVKLIYIDPPYNTGNDGFAYNDRFNHSTWLTFMKNRLEIAKEFLREDGVILVQIDENMGSYLKVLLDDESHFGRSNLINNFYIQVRYAQKSLNERDDFQKLIENVYAYAKNKSNLKPNKPKEEYSLDKFIYEFELKSPSSSLKLGNKEVEIYKEGSWAVKKVDPSIEGFKQTWASGSVLKGNTSGKFFADHLESRKSIDGIKTLYKVYGIGDDGLGYRIFLGPRSPKGNKGTFYSKIPLNKREAIESGKGFFKEKPIVNFYDMSADFGNIRHEGGVELRAGKKPEKLLNLFMNIFTNQSDIIMDFHLGSGTTAAVAHKIGRQYIGIEQMDYGKNSATTRLQNVIGGDSTGISKEVNWKGGGDFIYFELAEYNEEAKDKIDACKSYKELKKLFTELTDYYFLNYNVSVKQFNDQLLDDKDFQELSLEEQKTLFKALLDNNQLYIPYAEQKDGKYNLSKEEQELTRKFYG